MNAKFGKHWGKWYPKDGSCVVYGLQFQSVYQALKFLDPYPPGVDYVVVYNPSTEEVRLEAAESTFEFGPPSD